MLRSQDRPGLEQEVWALLTLYQLLRMAMVTAVESRPDTNPDRASFTTALQAARDQLIAADGDPPTDSPTGPGSPTSSASSAAPSWPRCCHPADPAGAPAGSRTPPLATSTATTDGPHLPTTITSIEVTLHTPSVDTTWRPRLRKPRDPNAGPTRRELITTLMEDDPNRPWRGRELADKLGIKPRNMLTQLAEWTRLGFLTRTDAGTYRLPTRRDTASP